MNKTIIRSTIVAVGLATAALFSIPAQAGVIHNSTLAAGTSVPVTSVQWRDDDGWDDRPRHMRRWHHRWDDRADFGDRDRRFSRDRYRVYGEGRRCRISVVTRMHNGDSVTVRRRVCR